MKKKNKGSILITTLWIMAILSVLALGIGFRSSLEVRLAKFSMDRIETRYLAKAGIVKAKAYLAEDNKKYDYLYECGIALKEEETPENIFGAEYNGLGAGSFYVEVSDEERKININMSKLSPDNKANYRKILNNLLPDPGVTEEETLTEIISAKSDIIDAILDWQDKDSVGNAENRYYGALEHPHKCKNKDFELVEELLLLKGMTPEYFGKIKDSVTVYGEGKLNVNTASFDALRAIIVHPEFTEKVVEHRKGGDGAEGTADDRFWRSAPEFSAFLASVGMTDTSAIERYFTVTSDYFRIASHGNAGKVKSTITCVVSRKAVSEKEKAENIFEYYREE